MLTRRFGVAVYRRLKARFEELCDAVGGQTEAARKSRADQTSLSRYISGSDDNALRFSPVDVILDLEAAAGRPVMTELLAEISGYMLVPMPRALLDGSDLALALGQLSREIGDVLSDLAIAFTDGRLTAAELSNGKKQIADAHRALAALEALLEAKAGKDASAGRDGA